VDRCRKKQELGHLSDTKLLTVGQSLFGVIDDVLNGGLKLLV